MERTRKAGAGAERYEFFIFKDRERPSGVRPLEENSATTGPGHGRQKRCPARVSLGGDGGRRERRGLVRGTRRRTARAPLQGRAPPAVRAQRLGRRGSPRAGERGFRPPRWPRGRGRGRQMRKDEARPRRGGGPPRPSGGSSSRKPWGSEAVRARVVWVRPWSSMQSGHAGRASARHRARRGSQGGQRRSRAEGPHPGGIYPERGPERG
jgi:hypothetical protein